jgi:ATP-binding cassette, subfamily C, bacterial PrsD
MESQSELRRALMRSRDALVAIGALSAVLNVLLLGGSLYMMMVYDSVLPSQSVPTLVGLLAMIAGVYAFQGAFDVMRSRLALAVAGAFDRRLTARVQTADFLLGLRGGADEVQPIRDLDAIRAFLTGPAPLALLDLPWAAFFLAVLAMLHPWLALTALAGALVLVALTVVAHRTSLAPTEAVQRQATARALLADERRRHAELIHALGMEPALRGRWARANQLHHEAQEALAGASGTLAAASRVLRMFLQSLTLSVGVLLVIEGRATGGVIFASSILTARALAPIDQVIGQWKGLAAARASWRRLAALLDRLPRSGVATRLPRPAATLSVENAAAVPPGLQQPTAHGLSFRLKAGDVLCVIGTSGAGKSSLARLLVGAWRPARGDIRLDGATLDQYAPEELGAALGYLPQTVELLSGTISDNIGRFAPQRDSERIVAAARAAGAHDLIVALPQGYDTLIGYGGGALSAGQRQRIALARALYGEPFLVVLDEPNSNLDAEGEAALDAAIKGVRERGGIVVLVTHRPAAVARATHVLVMKDGMTEVFGTKGELMPRLVRTGLLQDNWSRAA